MPLWGGRYEFRIALTKVKGFDGQVHMSRDYLNKLFLVPEIFVFSALMLVANLWETFAR